MIGTEPGELESIVEGAAIRNAALGITGMLWLDTYSFAQVLEGERAAIDGVMCSIKSDRRHADISIVCDREIKQPMFGGWSMTLPRDDPDAVRATAFLIGFARSEDTDLAWKLHEIAMASNEFERTPRCPSDLKTANHR